MQVFFLFFLFFLKRTANLHKNPLSAHPIPERMVYKMDLEKTVCYCFNITNGMIKEAVDSGASTLEEVQEATGAGTACGSCIDNIQHLIDQFVSEKK